MGFYLRKSVSVGPFRFNFSKSGIGVSAGIKGLRVGTGPRGNYISVGKGGLYYRVTLNQSNVSKNRRVDQSDPILIPEEVSVDQMVSIESAPIAKMQDETSMSLINELNEKFKRPNYWKWVLGLNLVLIWYLPRDLPTWLNVIIYLGLIGITAYIATRDAVAKSVVLCYQLEPNNESSYELLHSAFAKLSTCHKKWRIDSHGTVRDRKYHAGAGAVITRKEAVFSKGLPPNVKCNLEVPLIKAGPNSLYFMPDRLLILSQNQFGAINYNDLNIDVSSNRFIESNGVPRDSEVVDQTWRYVNKKGGPDKRFKDNRQIPVTLYEELHFTSASGLNELFQISKHSVGKDLSLSLKKMQESLPL